jgi:CRP/FNR family transcriptional regulator
MSVTIDTFANIAAFRGLSLATSKRLAQEAALVSRKRGETLFRQGDPAPGLFILMSGRVKLYRQSKERMQIFAILAPGDCFGAESVAGNVSGSCTATTITPVMYAYLPLDKLRLLLVECPDLQIGILELISERLQQFVSVVHNLAFRDVPARMAGVLLTLAHLEGETTDDGIRIPRLLTQQELACMVGTAREVIHRTFKSFERDHLVHLTSTDIFILDAQKLAEISKQEAR